MSPQDHDSEWKKALDHHLPALLTRLTAEVHGEIDGSHDFEPLEQEMRKMAPWGHRHRRLFPPSTQAMTFRRPIGAALQPPAR
jgi:hypothetical protein